MHIQPNHSVAFVHLFRFLSFMFVCWTEGAAGLRRMPHKQTSGAARIYSPRTSTRVASVRTHSAFDRGVTPLRRSSPCRHCSSALVLSFASPIGTIERPDHAPRPAQLHS